MTAAERITLQKTTAILQANADRTSHNAGLVAAAGGLVGSLGRALEEGDAVEIGRQVDALSAELNDKANALWEAFTARTTVEGLEKQLAQARAAQAVLQKQVETAVAAQRAAPVPSPSPVAPPAPPAPVEPATNGDDDAGLAHLSALALLLSGKEPPALDADRLQALIGDVETTRNVRGQDLLQMIDGIDADTEARLDAAGVPTYRRLARATPKTIAAAAGVDAETAERWIQQAGAIVSGARPGRNRLTVLRGLEPAMQAKLYDAGIDTYAAVADGDEAQLCTVAGLGASHKADVAIWIFQAKLLAAAPNYRIPQPAAQRPVEETSS
jgi:predicted flap endonuclease-1-like 5' DNA nuclease